MKRLFQLLFALCGPIAAAASPLASTSVSLPATTGYAVYAELPGITADLQLTTELPLPASIEYSNCAIGPVSRIELPADAAKFVTKFATAMCPKGAIGVAKVTATNANVSTFVRFRFADGHETAFELPLLTHRIGSAATPTEARLLTHTADKTFTTALVLFNVGSEPASFDAVIYDDTRPGEPPLREVIVVAPTGGPTWYEPANRFESGRIELIPADSASEVYGFVAISTANGDAPRLRTLAPKRTLPAPPTSLIQ